ARRAARPGVADPRSRGPAPPRLPGAPLRGDDLLRLLVRPGARGPAGAHGRLRPRRDGDRTPQALQGQRHRGGPPLAALALPHGFRDVRGRRRLSPARRRRVHQPERAAAPDPRSPRPPALSAVRVDVALTAEDVTPAHVGGASALVVDVLRASSTI